MAAVSTNDDAVTATTIAATIATKTAVVRVLDVWLAIRVESSFWYLVVYLSSFSVSWTHVGLVASIYTIFGANGYGGVFVGNLRSRFYCVHMCMCLPYEIAFHNLKI